MAGRERASKLLSNDGGQHAFPLRESGTFVKIASLLAELELRERSSSVLFPIAAFRSRTTAPYTIESLYQSL